MLAKGKKQMFGSVLQNDIETIQAPRCEQSGEVFSHPSQTAVRHDFF